MRASYAFVIVAAIAVRTDASPNHGDSPEVTGAVTRPVTAKHAAFTGVPMRPALERVRNGKRSDGVLTGKTVYVSAGHGWLYSLGAWRTQRDNTNDLVEDFITIEGVNEYLVQYLHAMGAYVVPIREADLNPNLVIVDDGDATIEGTVDEAPNRALGWGAFPVPLDSVSLQPFAQGTTRLMTASASETGRARFAATIAEAGYYNVYVAYAQGPDRVSDAHVIVQHAGGESHVRIDQRRHGSTWVLLGRWYFAAGASAAVAFANDSAEPGRMISFDAVRFGGGMSVHRRDGATTGRPAFETAAAYSTQLLGAPTDVYDYFGESDTNDDVVARPRFAAWEHEGGEDAIYLAWHTNAPAPGRGTMSIAFGNTYPCCRGLDDFAGTAGSLELLHAVHDEILGDVRAAYDPTWRDAGKVTAALGELNPGHNDEMPAILVELAFHSTEADANALRDPKFRRLAARAMAQGVAKYFAARDGRAAVMPPEPPIAVRVENAGAGTLRVSWRAPTDDAAGGDAPTAYRVYLSDNGYGFDDGIVVEGSSLELRDLPRAALRFVRVAAINDGGESLPTEVVGARLAASGAAPVLVVGGFDRLDGHLMLRDEAPLVGVVDRQRLDRMNDGTYAARHGRALADAGFAFDGATDEAIGDLELARYKAIDWFTGEQANASAWPAATRDAVTQYLAGGGHLLLSGSELIWALTDRGTPDDQAFARDVLHVSLASDDAETYDVMALDGPLGPIGALSFLDTASGGYDAEFPDVLVPGDAAIPVLEYATGGAAAIAWPQGIVLGFPLEVVQGDAARQQLVATALAHFGVEPDADPPDPDDPDEPTPTGCGCASGGDPSWLLVFAVAMRLRRRRQ